MRRIERAWGSVIGLRQTASGWLQALAAVGTLAVIGVGLFGHFSGQHSEPSLPGERKRVIAFRQLADRICTENLQNQQRAMSEAQSREEGLGFAARAVGWNVNDLESVTAPLTRSGPFTSEVAVRRMAERETLALQGTVESGNSHDRTAEVGKLEHLEGRSRELSREAGIVRCERILPPLEQLLSR